MASLKGKTIFITGASRGIGKAIGLRAARDGANIVVAAKTTEPHPKLDGTIYTAVEGARSRRRQGPGLHYRHPLRRAGSSRGRQDRRRRSAASTSWSTTPAPFSLTGTLDTPMKRYDLMHGINTRGTFLTSKLCLPHLLKAANPHILNISPPLSMEPRWFAPHVAYTMAKYGMSMCVLGMAEEFSEQGVAVNALWPRTAIATAAVQNLLGGDEAIRRCRKPEIMADAAHAILTRDSRECTGNFFIDDDVLRAAGVTDFDHYASRAGRRACRLGLFSCRSERQIARPADLRRCADRRPTAASEISASTTMITTMKPRDHQAQPQRMRQDRAPSLRGAWPSRPG